MEKRYYTVYRFKELSKEAKENAIKLWYDGEDYPFLESDLTESCKALLERYKIKEIDNSLKLFYSLSYCQGDGLCFIGSFEYKKKRFIITHNYQYYFAQSVNIEAEEEETSDKLLEDFKKKYLIICRELEKEGYGVLEYRMNEQEFNELCSANNYYFTADGKLD